MLSRTTSFVSGSRILPIRCLASCFSGNHKTCNPALAATLFSSPVRLGPARSIRIKSSRKSHHNSTRPNPRERGEQIRQQMISRGRDPDSEDYTYVKDGITHRLVIPRTGESNESFYARVADELKRREADRESVRLSLNVTTPLLIFSSLHRWYSQIFLVPMIAPRKSDLLWEEYPITRRNCSAALIERYKT
jgi:hypothetical protein